MPLADHLRELRKRLVLAAGGLVVGTIGGWFLYPPVFQLLQEPVARLQEQGINASLNFGGGVASTFDVQLRISFFIGVLISSPWWIYQLWAFLAPGLTGKERRSAISFITVGVPLFLGGIWMAWIALPNTFALLTQFLPEGQTSSIFIEANTYIKFVVQFLLIFGFAFLLPMVLVVLNLLGVVRGITWLKGWRWAVIVIFMLAALATPTADPVTFVLMSLPIVALYFLAVGLSLMNDHFRDKRRAKRDAKLDTELAQDTASDSSDTP